MTNFKLFMGCLGNGVTVCNSEVEEHGDYKQIAHIAECGVVKWYTNPIKIPAEAVEKIESTATEYRQKWENHLESIGKFAAYRYLLDNAPHAAFMHIMQDKESGMQEKIDYLKAAYINALKGKSLAFL